MQNKRLRASLVLMVGGAFWGLLWIPLRAFEGMGLEGAWSTLMAYTAPAILLVPLSIWRWRTISAQLGTFIAVGAFCGVSFALYGVAVLLTEINRVILLFYLTPLWGTVIGVVFLREQLTVQRVIALMLGFIGLLVVLDLGIKFPWPRNIGDWMAFVAGITWALGSTALYRSGGVKAIDQASAFVIGGTIFTGLLLVVAGGSMGSMPTGDAVAKAVPLAILMALVTPPVLIMTIWPATLLSPGRAGILLMTEVLFGLGSAWMLANEILGPRELIGAALILSATVLEVTAQGPSSPPQSKSTDS
jgi:drug/metabolite transporter (DMT)-like permease